MPVRWALPKVSQLWPGPVPVDGVAMTDDLTLLNILGPTQVLAIGTLARVRHATSDKP